MQKNKKKRIVEAAIASTLAVGLAGCNHHDFIACHGVAKPGSAEPYVIMDKGLCGKLANGVAKPLPVGVSAPKTDDNDYVMCYGVAAAGKNDCGTKSTACAGSVGTAKDPGAWVAALDGVCKKIGGRVGDIKPK